jgi:hypothetical protein
MRVRTMVLLGIVLGGCRPGPDTGAAVPEPDSTAVARARQAAGTLGQELLGALGTALQHGPEHALAFCADSAQRWSARHRQEGLEVRRTSLRVRNPLNRPDTVERRILDRLAAAHRAASLPEEYREVLRLPDGGFALQLARPVVVQPMCLACHGDPATFAPEVRAVLASRYPADSAVGYAAGDFRGMVSVRLRLED